MQWVGVFCHTSKCATKEAALSQPSIAILSMHILYPKFPNLIGIGCCLDNSLALQQS